MSQNEATLCIDIGGTGLKLLVCSGQGKALTERLRVETPQPATPAAVLGALKKLLGELKAPYTRVSVGFPGVVVSSVVQKAPHLHLTWAGYPLGDAIGELT